MTDFHAAAATADTPIEPSLPEGWELIVGLEVHVELDTETKLFCGCANRFGSAMGLPSVSSAWSCKISIHSRVSSFFGSLSTSAARRWMMVWFGLISRIRFAAFPPRV